MNQVYRYRRDRGTMRIATNDFADESRVGGVARGQEAVGAAVDAKLDVAKLLDLLSLEHRQVIVLRELQQMSYDEMAATLRVPRGTIESRLHRARAELKLHYLALGMG